MPKTKPMLEVIEDQEDSDDEQTIDETPAAEPEIETVPIVFRGFTFTVPKDMDDWETEACLAMSQNEYVLAAKLLLGPQQWMILQSLGSKRRDIREFLALFADIVNRDCVS